MTADAPPSATLPPARDRAMSLFQERMTHVWQRTDRLFAGLFVFQYVAGIAAALWISPFTWQGTTSSVHVHVLAASVLGALIVSLPVGLAWAQPGRTLTRHTVAASQMLFSALLIHLLGGRIETHFHVFGSLAFLAFYRDWKVLITATVVVAADHLIRGALWPQSVFGVITPDIWRAIEHAGWVIFEDIFLIWSCHQGVREMQNIAAQQAEIESTNQLIEAKVRQRTRELRDSEAQISSILESAADAIITINDRGIIESFNPAAEQLFGYHRDDAIGRNISEMMPAPYAEEHDNSLQRYLLTGERRVIGIGREVTGRRRDGSSFPLELAVSEVRLGDRRLFTGIVRDITERRAAAQQLEDQAGVLAERNAELREMKNAAEQANVAKSRFLANMSHELRTPMNAIIGYSEMLQEECVDAGNDDLLPDLQRIHSASRHLLNLINDVLDLSKIEAGKMQVFAETFLMGPFVEEVLETVQPLMEQKGNSLVVRIDGDPAQACSDQTKIRQILFNLLSNAAKFTEQGQVKLEVIRSRMDDADWITFIVSDTGIGMTEEQLRKIFDAFTQAEESTTRRFGGTGLGLTITKRFCEILGGELRVESESGLGSRFTVSLPLRYGTVRPADDDQDHAVTASQLLPDPPTTGRAVLVVDDDSDARDLMRRYLEKENYVVITAASGPEGLRLARKHSPVAITLDVMMPGMDGWAVLQQLKQDPTTADIPVVMISMLDNAEIGFALGVADYLIKPPCRQRLSEILARLRHNDDADILIVDDDPDSRRMLRRLVARTGCTIREARDGRQALAMIADREPSLMLLDLMMPEVDGFEVVAELKQQGRGHDFPIVVLTARDLSASDRSRLQGLVRNVHQKAGVSRHELLNEIRLYLSQCCPEPAEALT